MRTTTINLYRIYVYRTKLSVRSITLPYYHALLGSWGNTQKLAAKTWRYELFYWDYVIGIVLLSLIVGFTLGSIGDHGRSFTDDIAQVSSNNFWSAFAGGIIFNAANILLSASISLAGMSVAFPVGVGLALVLGYLSIISAPPKVTPSFSSQA